MDQFIAARIVDANLNRAGEGLRVVEEYARFGLGDRGLGQLAKSLRHDLARLFATGDGSQLIRARDTLGDVGTQTTTPDEYDRVSVQDVARASTKRVEQALRCLEEYGKLFSAETAAGCEQLRYRVYTLAKAIEITAAARQRLADVRLYVLIDGQATEEAFVRLATELVRARVDVLQLRDKQLADCDLLRRARRLRELTRQSSTLFLVNDRADVAALADADGVHVGQDELTTADCRRIMGPSKLVGVSTHSLEQVRRAVLDGADYIGCGPTFPSATKSFAEFPGLAFLRQAAEETTLPAFAIGGIDLDNLDQVLATGLRRVAVGSAVTAAANPPRASGEFRRRLGADSSRTG